MELERMIKDCHQDMIDKGFYKCPKCKDQRERIDKLPKDTRQINKFYFCGYCGSTMIDPHKNIGELLMLIVTELSEALKAHRCGRFTTHPERLKLIDFRLDSNILGFERYIKDTLEDEIADVFLRLFDLCGYLKIIPEVKINNRPFSDNIGEELLNLASFCIEIFEIFKIPPIRQNVAVKIQIDLFLSDLIMFCKYHKIDIEKHIDVKMAYNKTREYKHGKEY